MNILKDDPNERNNLALKFPCKLKELELEIENYKLKSVPPLVKNPFQFSVNSDPAKFGDKWQPGWCH